MRALLAGVALLTLAGCSSARADAPVKPGTIFAIGVENFYADIIQQIGGDRVTVTALLKSPNVDPHEYEPTAADAVAVANARLVLMNGLGYDSWMSHLLLGSSGHRTVIVAGEVAGLKEGANPHVWYDLRITARVSRTVTSALARLDPAHAAYFQRREQRFLRSLASLRREVRDIRQAHAGARVAETEPVFGYMISALGLQVPESGFQRAIAQGADPSPRAVIDFQTLLRGHRVQALVYNRQAVEPITETMASIARANHIPVVGVTETEPAGETYQSWIRSELGDLRRAIGG